MPRKARITVPGAFHHLMARGIDGKDIYQDDDDREKFLSLVAIQLPRNGHRLYAWALMPNHYHMVLRASDQPLAEMMRKINSTYARYYNKKYSRRGYLFQDRFKSIVAQDQDYVKEVLRYVHLNPVRAGICRDLGALDHYPWSGHAILMGYRNWAVQEVKEVLEGYSKSPQQARTTYRKFMAEGLALGSAADDVVEAVRKSNLQKEDMLDPGCWVIGDREYVKDVLKRDNDRRTRLARFRAECISLDYVAQMVSVKCGVPAEEFVKRSRGGRASDVRKIFAYVCRHHFEFPVREIGQFLGIGSSPASISIALGEKLAREEKILID